MSAISEDKKINLFYLKDILLNKEATMHEKMEALSQIRKNATMPVFKFAVESVLLSFKQIPELVIQIEIINAIGKSQ